MKRKHEENTLFEGTPVQFSRSALNQRFILPPFSVLSARDGEWQKRKNLWLSLGVQSELGRGGELLGLSQAAKWWYNHKDDTEYKELNEESRLAQGTSIFDPVLCELCYSWFCPPGGQILDPFAGGSVRGIVAGVLGFKYSGCDLRAEQIEANIAQGNKLLSSDDPMPTWVAGDSVEIQRHLPGEYDYVFSCPPYGDLEVYSDDAADISNMDRDQFMLAYKSIIKNACAMLKDDSFACFVVGDYRDKNGNFANFPAVTTEAFREAGLQYYNEAILVTAVGSLPIRVSYQFPISRKLGRTHQNVLVYCKGDPFRASAKIAGKEMPTLKVRNISQRPAAVLPPVAWTPPDSFPDLQRCKRIAIDVETRDEDLKKLGPGTRRGAYIVGLSVATDGGFKGYFPIRHEGGGNMDPEQVLNWARDQFTQYRGEVVGHNLMYDLDFLANENILFDGVTFMDTMIAEPLLNEHLFDYSLEGTAQRYLGRGKSEAMLNHACEVAGYKDAKSNLWRLPGAYVGAYGEDDTQLPLDILPLQLEKLEALGLTDLFKLECSLTPMLLHMRRNGVKVNINKAEQVRFELAVRRDAAVAEFRRLLGRPKAEIMAKDSFADALADRGLKMQRTEKGAISIRKPWLEANKHDPAIAQLLLARRMDKTIGTFLDGHILGHHVNGRIHTQFHQLKGEDGGTIGRFSSSDPNLQNIPARDEELAPLIRSIFEPEEGCEWERGDYSQIEVRLEAHYAVGPRADEFRQRYIDDPKTDYHKMTAEWIGVDPEDKYKRKMVKGTNFAKKYGAMAPKLASIIGCTIDEAKDFVRKYEAALPWTKATFDKCQNLANARGYVRTLLGRYARFPLWEPAANARRKFEDRVPAYPRERAETEYPGQHLVRANTYTAMNNVFQLGSADMLKKAMVDMWEAGLCKVMDPLLTVHDEMDLNKPRTKEAREASREIKYIMEHSIKLKVPVVVDMESGPNWGACG